jgi:hypothetical protein
LLFECVQEEEFAEHAVFLNNVRIPGQNALCEPVNPFQKGQGRLGVGEVHVQGPMTIELERERRHGGRVIDSLRASAKASGHTQHPLPFR